MAYLAEVGSLAAEIIGYKVRWRRQNGLQATSRRFNQAARAESFARRLPFGSNGTVVPVLRGRSPRRPVGVRE